MIAHNVILDRDLRIKIKRKEILLGGNKNLKIYGKLGCKSGKRMKRKNRVFFSSEKEALQNNFRPCGHCMNKEYKKWKNEAV
ncbi:MULTISPECIES: Ada metal-binding domain-containing protein [Aquimarina]|uniref:Ada metal-binding domain-containing protein n=1 Tax=Aquimarina TaxID=290174 RepID=UPI000CDF1425|nr:MULTISPECIES: Ada metal-binding domain-containing protein [Aquimarina]